MDIANTLKQVAQSLFVRRKKWIILATVAALALLLPAAYLLSREPPRYQTTATIFLESRTQSPLFQEFAPFRPLAVQLAILQSRVLAQSVFEALPRAAVEDLIRNPYGNDIREDLQNWFLRLRGVQPIVESPESRALGELRNARVAFIPQGGTGLVLVRADASSPRVALDIANAYVEVMIARTRSFNVDDAKSTREYLSQQGSQVGEALQTSDKAFREFTLTKGALKLPERVSDMATRLSELEGTVAEVQANRNLSQVRLTALRAKLDAMPAPAKSATPTAPPIQTQRLRARLAAFEGQLADARTRFTDEHPRIRLLRQQIAEVQRELGDAVKDSTSADLAGSSVPAEDRSAFAEMVAALDTSVASLSGQEGALREQIANLRKNLSGLSKDELEYRRLASDVETNRRLGSMIQEKLAASRISQTGEMNLVKIVDPASTPVPAVNQKRLKYLGIALALGLVLGVAGPGLAEYVNRPLQSEQAIRQSTGLPILAIVPQVESRRPVFTSGERQPQDPQQQD